MLLPLLLTTLVPAGCAKEVKAEFPRPPATATLPLPPETVPSTEESVSDDNVDGNDRGNGDPVPATEFPEPEDEAKTSSSRTDDSLPPESRRPPPSTPPRPASPPSTQLGERGSPDNSAVTVKLSRARSLLNSVALRELSAEQRQQLNEARGFVAQARRAHRDGDERRALVLVDKGLILVGDVERASRR